jgi:hypothetical protein
MQKLVAVLLIVILAGSVTIPNVFSDDEKNTNDNNENENHQNQTSTQENENDDKDNKTKVHFGFSNATSVNITLPNGTTITFGFSNGTNPGQQISNFIHQIRDAFKQQEDLAKQTIKDCREKAKGASPADRKTIMNECKAQLKQINQEFKGEHKQLQLDFKQFREMVIGNNQENHEKPEKQNDTKIQNPPQIVPKPNGPEQKKPHDQKGNVALQNTTLPNQHGQQQKLEHANQNGKQKHGNKD